MEWVHLIAIEPVPERDRLRELLHSSACLLPESLVHVADIDGPRPQERPDRRRRAAVGTDRHEQASSAVPEGRATPHHRQERIEIALRDSERPLGPPHEIRHAMLAIQMLVEHDCKASSPKRTSAHLAVEPPRRTSCLRSPLTHPPAECPRTSPSTTNEGRSGLCCGTALTRSSR